MCVFTYESFAEEVYQPNVAAKIVGLAFLSAVSAWEDFVEDVYLGYLAGYPAPSGYKPRPLAGTARSRAHALLVASGEPTPRDAERRLRWSNFGWVQALSEVHFEKSNVFTQVSPKDVAWLDLAQTLRNRVAHNSEKAKTQYKSALNRLMGDSPARPLPRGFGPGKFLTYQTNKDKVLLPLAKASHQWPDVFEGYVSLWERLAEQLCPG